LSSGQDATSADVNSSTRSASADSLKGDVTTKYGEVQDQFSEQQARVEKRIREEQDR
jgi:uncharacterized protein YjbJ (UPF0337 family)